MQRTATEQETSPQLQQDVALRQTLLCELFLNVAEVRALIETQKREECTQNLCSMVAKRPCSEGARVPDRNTRVERERLQALLQEKDAARSSRCTRDCARCSPELVAETWAEMTQRHSKATGSTKRTPTPRGEQKQKKEAAGTVIAAHTAMGTRKAPQTAARSSTESSAVEDTFTCVTAAYVGKCIPTSARSVGPSFTAA